MFYINPIADKTLGRTLDRQKAPSIILWLIAPLGAEFQDQDGKRPQRDASCADISPGVDDGVHVCSPPS